MCYEPTTPRYDKALKSLAAEIKELEADLVVQEKRIEKELVAVEKLGVERPDKKEVMKRPKEWYETKVQKMKTQLAKRRDEGESVLFFFFLIYFDFFVCSGVSVLGCYQLSQPHSRPHVPSR